MVRSFVEDVLEKAKEEAYKNNVYNNNNNIDKAKSSFFFSLKVGFSSI